MTQPLTVNTGFYSDKGRKDINQDALGYKIPNGNLRRQKGIVFAIADGISSSSVSQIASENAVQSFIDDYYCTSDAWSLKHSALTAMQSINNQLYTQTQQSPYRYDKDRGYVCTFSALILKAHLAEIVHIGDARVYRIANGALEQLTNDHRYWTSQQQSYLSRALGIQPDCDVDSLEIQLNCDDTFVLCTDGIYEFVQPESILQIIAEHKNNLEAAAQIITKTAFDAGSTDNLSIQIVYVEALPVDEPSEVQTLLDSLPLPPSIDAGQIFDGYRILRTLYNSARSHVYLAQDAETDELVVLKTPSLDLSSDPAYLERFLMEEWIARRIKSPYVLAAGKVERDRNYIYTVSEYIEGQTLAQWHRDNPRPSLETVRQIIEQLSKGLRSFHRMDMLHQDLKPENILIDTHNNIKIIDFGSTYVAGVAERTPLSQQDHLLGTALYAAPEYFLGEVGSTRSDLYSLGVITYFLLSGKYPYGTKVPGARTLSAQRKLAYQSVLNDELAIPSWIDEAIRKAVHTNPLSRYEDSAEFIYDLRHPNKDFLNKTRRPLIERNPTAFWQGVSFVLSCIVVYLLYN